MPRAKKGRPKRYKSYNHAFGEEDVEYEIPESTLRSQNSRKRKRDDDSSSNSTDGENEVHDDDAANAARFDCENMDEFAEEVEVDHHLNHQSSESNSEPESDCDGSTSAHSEGSQMDCISGEENSSSESEYLNFHHQTNKANSESTSNGDIQQSETSSFDDQLEGVGSQNGHQNWDHQSSEADNELELDCDGSNSVHSEGSQVDCNSGEENSSSESEYLNFNRQTNEANCESTSNGNESDGQHSETSSSDDPLEGVGSQNGHQNWDHQSSEANSGYEYDDTSDDTHSHSQNQHDAGGGSGNEHSSSTHQTTPTNSDNESDHYEDGGGLSESAQSSDQQEGDEDGGLQDSGNEHEQDENGGFHYIEPFRKLKAKLQEEFQNPLNKTVNLTVGEILTNALTLVKKHNWNHTEKEDLMKFVNSLFDSNVVPGTRYLLDQYFYSKEGMRYHFFCSACTKMLLSTPAATHSETQIVCPNPSCLKVNCISDLQKASFFVTFDLPYQLKLLLDNPSIRSKVVNPIDFKSEPEDKVMRDLYHGSSYRSFANYVHNLSDTATKFLSLSLSVDSAALCSGFSGQSICPCFIMLNELPPVIRSKHLLIAGLWFGVEKEKLDLFLPPIVKHLTELSSPGFSLHFRDVTWNVKAFLIACIADSVARCDVQGIHAHRGDFPCSWCLCEGEEYVSCRIFPYTEILPPPRTIEELLQDSRQAERENRFVRGVKYMCLLAAAPMFHPVHGFICDQMHAKDEGTTKAFLNSWLGEDGKTPYYLGQPNIRKINRLLTQVKIPRELRKGVRTLKHLSYFTGRELENWSFFLSLAVLPGSLPDRFLKHWGLYVQGTYLLLLSAIHSDVVNLGEDLLEEFCRKTKGLYGRHMMRFNLHILRHFAENCRRWGPLFALSAYACEAGNQRIKNQVHDCNGVPSQICRGVSEDNALSLLKDSCDSEMTRSFAKSIEPKSHVNRVELVGKIELKGFPKAFKASEEEKWHFNELQVNLLDCVEFPLLKKDGCHFGPGSSHRQSKTDNSYAKLQNTNIVHIAKIIFNERTKDIWIVGNRVRCEPSPYCPLKVVRYDCSLCCQYVVNSIDEDIIVFDVNELSTVCVSLPFEHGHYITPMPNIFNMY